MNHQRISLPLVGLSGAPFLSGLLVSVLVGLLTGLPAESGLQAAPQVPPPLVWEDVKAHDYSGIAPPREDENIEMADQALLVGSRLFWSGRTIQAGQEGQNDKKGSPAVIFRDLQTGEAGRFAIPSPVLGMAVDPARGHLALRLREALMWVDPRTGEETDRITLPLARNRQPVAFYGRRLLLLDENRLDTYDAETGQRLKQGSPLPMEKVQRAVACGTHIYLWSSYGGSKVLIYDPAAPAAQAPELQAGVSHRLFWKMACVNDEKETLAVFDPPSAEKAATYVEFIRSADRLLAVVPGMQRISDGAAYRHSALQDRVTFTLRIRAEKDMPDGGEVAVTIPPSITTEQILTGETFPSNGDLRLDHLGNRTLMLRVSAMRKDEVRDVVAYRADLKRYKVDFQIETAATSFSSLEVPPNLKIYLDDEPQYRIQDPYLVEIRQRLMKDAPTVESYANAVYREVRKRLVYKQDGRFDPAPTVLQNGHGSCTEHSFVQIALLRGAGIPARLAWNWLPVGTEPGFNHKIAEVWLPRYGWVPAEPLSTPRRSVGTTYGHHLIFASLERPRHEIIRGGDRLASFTRGAGTVEVKITVEPAVTSVAERGSLPPEEVTGSAEDATIQPRSMSPEERASPERTVQ